MLHSPPSEPNFASINDDIPALLRKYYLENEVHLLIPLHKAILEKNRPLINDLIQLCSPSILTSVTPRFKLTPLHLAAILDDQTTCLELLNAKADPNSTDWKGWTPLHHCALLGYEKMMKILLEFGANPTLKNSYEGTPYDIQRLTNYTPCDEDELLPVYYKDKDKPEYQLTAKEWRELTSSNYIKENVISREFFIKNWITPDSDKLYKLFLEVSLKIKSKLASFLENQPSFCLYPATEDECGNPLLSSPGLGIKSRTHFEPGDIIGEYTGLYSISGGFHFSDYAVKDGPDACLFGNEMSRANDGFPNCALIYVPNEHGLPTRNYLVAIEKIEAGQPIVWNYGVHSVKLGPYTEFRPRTLREFLKNTPLEQTFDLMTNAEADQGANFSNFLLGIKGRYFINTPPVLFSLVLEKYIKISESSFIGIVNIVLGNMEFLRLSILSFVAKDCLDIHEKILQIDPETAEEFITHFQKATQKFTLEKVLENAQQCANSFKSFFQKEAEQIQPLSIRNHWKEWLENMNEDIR